MSLGENSLSGASEARQREGRCRLADQRRGHVARVEVEPDGEQYDENDKADQRPEKIGSSAVL
jgi:hypothetical protein